MLEFTIDIICTTPFINKPKNDAQEELPLPKIQSLQISETKTLNNTLNIFQNLDEIIKINEDDDIL